MRRLLPDEQMAFEVLVERHAELEQIADAFRRLARHRIGNALVDQSGAGRDRVARMRLRRVTFGDRRRDTALRPGARRTFADRGGGDDGDRAR